VEHAARMGVWEMNTKFWPEILKEREDLEVDRRIIMKLILEK
jgi:hypothetical protein